MNFGVNMIVVNKAVFENYKFCISAFVVEEIEDVGRTFHKTVIAINNVKVAMRIITTDGVVYFKY